MLPRSVFGIVLLLIATTLAEGPQLWPEPQQVTLSNADEFYLASNFSFPQTNLPILQQAFTRYTDIIYGGKQYNSTHFATGLKPFYGFQLTIVDPSYTFIQFGADESYELIINNNFGILIAYTVFGAMHALETFSQLVRNFQLPSAVIYDYPAYPWRGLLLDTSRHYQTLDTIYRVIRGLSYDKMNVFHWHMSDGQSFPYASQVYPDLIKGAYSPESIYTIQNITDVINYANSYGVRVVVEFDMPSHAGPSWGAGYPFLTMNCTTPNCLTPQGQYSDPCNDFPFDATSNEVYAFLNNFIGEISSVFPDNYLHMGGDEVQTYCWNVTYVNEWMDQHNMTSYSQLEQYFLTNVQQYAVNRNKLIVNWEEVFSSNFTLQPGTIIEVWKDHETMARVVRAGHPALLAYNWYLDHLNTGWSEFYHNDPARGIFDPEELKLVYGGECCMWGETADYTNVDPKVWPRTSAAGERLWSGSLTRLSAFTRIQYQRCRFVKRGIMASPIYPGPPCSTYDI